MVFTIWSFLLIASASQCIFLLILFLVRPSKNRKAQNLISIILLVLLAINVNNIWYSTHLFVQVPNVAGFARGMILLLGPLFYLYTQAVSDRHFKFKASMLLHLIPYLLIVISLQLQDGPANFDEAMKTLEAFMDGRLPITFLSVLRFGIYITHMLVYLVLSRTIFVKIDAETKREYAVSLSERKKWLEQITVFLFLMIAALIYFEIRMVLTGYYTVIGNYIITLIASGFIYFIAFRAILSANRLMPDFNVQNPVSGQQHDNPVELGKQVLTLLEEKKLYKNHQLKVVDMANELNVGTHVISSVLNGIIGKSFFELVNGYRIEEFKKLSVSNSFQEYSIMGLATEVGFKSKSSFNTAFKKHTGMTPSEFLKQQKAHS